MCFENKCETIINNIFLSMVNPNTIFGTRLHAIGGISAASRYSKATYYILIIALVILILSFVIMTYGSVVGERV